MTDRAQIERERAIAEKAWLAAQNRVLGPQWQSGDMKAYLDREYPLPQEEPRIVTGKSGRRYRVDLDSVHRQQVRVLADGRWVVSYGWPTVDAPVIALALLGPEGTAGLFERMLDEIIPNWSKHVGYTRARAIGVFPTLCEDAQ